MKKLFPLILMVMIFAGCQAGKDIAKPVDKLVDPVADVLQPIGKNLEGFVSDTVGVAGAQLDKLFSLNSGYAYVILAVELNANVSSLLVDKTKEKVVGYSSNTAKKLTPGSFFFVIPPRVSDGESFHYDEEMGRIIRNYLTLAKYGIPVSTPEQAEYIVVTKVRESLSKTYGTNYSEVSFSIMDKFDLPAYTASIRVESKSDRNFWYYPTKKARPVKKLTMKGLTHIMAEGLPEAHGQVKEMHAFAKMLSMKKKEK